MSRFTYGKWPSRLVAMGCTLAIFMIASMAAAAGRIDWGNNKTLKPRSDGNSWNIDIKIFLPRPPDVPTIQLKFEFDQKVYYERAMMDGDKLVTRNVPIEGKQPVTETVDVGFLDPETSRIEKRTRFTFKLHRDHGFDCGEYKVTVRDTRNGQMVGAPTTLILGGENEVIDRRSIVFTGEKKKAKKTEDKKDKAEGGEAAGSEEPKKKAEKSESEASDESAAPAKEAPPAEDPAADSSETIKKKPGGCGCRVPGHTETPSGWLLLAAASGLALARRGRARSTSTSI